MSGSGQLPLNTLLLEQLNVRTYGYIVFSVLFIISLLMFVLRKNLFSIDQVFKAGDNYNFGWVARCAYVEARLAFRNAKSM
ncbi:hypothetical protein MWMV10_MWMV10_03066 [Acinetobacter baumannii]|nr:hypothetical protein MWMV10_MWMV10_03066 [Acinetobacter baumannii]CAI4205977.1 hypothetical protein MWMV15_MWMV15_03107 [Acinetobacter baumannii]SSO51376.1 Uncharacterised protein [Acinetobacter baumannii]